MVFNFPFFPRKGNSAQAAKERLQILLAHDRAGSTGPDYLPMLQREILEVVKRHVQIDGDSVDIRIDKGADISCLEINIELPAADKMGAQGAN